MARHLEVACPTPVPGKDAAEALRGDPGEWLPLPARRRGLEKWTVSLHALVFSRTVACRLGQPWVHQGGSWRTLAWNPEAERHDAIAFERLLPRFQGEIGVDVDADGGGIVRLRGRYRPPLGFIGAVLDAALRQVAVQTAERFVAEIARRLASQEDRQTSEL